MSDPLVSTHELERLYYRVTAAAPALRHGSGVAHHGPFASLLRGHGLELADLRPYQWGDDPRHMDWRATARSGKPVTKVFVDERLRRVFLLIDRGPGMAFATRGRLKAAMAVELAAVLAFAALARREGVAGAVFDGTHTRFFPAAGTLDGVLPMLHQAAAPLHVGRQADPPQAFAQLLATLDAAVPAQTSVFLISDFGGAARAHLAPLLRLAQRRKLAALRVQDPAESVLPAAGVLRLASPLTGRSYEIDTGDAALREAYAQAAARRHLLLQTLMRDAGVPLLTVSTDGDPLDSLESVPWTTTH